MMTLEQAMAKATKLLRLAESSNANEAALAAEMAQKILTRYNIDAAALAVDGASEPVEDIRDFNGSLNSEARVLASWKIGLANSIARANNCRAYSCGASIGLVGRQSDVAKVISLYGMLASEVDRLTVMHGKGKGRAYCNSFRVGVVDAINEKLRETHAKVAAEMRAEAPNPDALARVNNALQRVSDRGRDVDAWVRANMRLGSRRVGNGSDSSGRADGYRAGQSIGVGGSRRALGTGQGRLT